MINRVLSWKINPENILKNYEVMAELRNERGKQLATAERFYDRIKLFFHGDNGNPNEDFLHEDEVEQAKKLLTEALEAHSRPNP